MCGPIARSSVLEGGEVILNTTRITVQPDKRTEFLQTIGRLLEPIKSAKGCVTFCFYVDAADENSSLLMGEWETASDLDEYLHSNDFAILRGAITTLSARCVDFQALVTSRDWRDEPQRRFKPSLISLSSKVTDRH